MQARCMVSAMMTGALLASCTTTSGTLPISMRSTSPRPAASAKAGTASPPSPASQGTAPGLLMPPRAGAQALAGTVSLDAHYLVAAGAASIVSAGGAQVIAAGAGNIVANDGATIVANDGATVIAGGAGNLIVPAAGGAAIVANDGATIVANDGATLIGQDGTSLIGQGRSSYALLAAKEVPIGTILPAAGIHVSALSLSSHTYLPVGVDAKGAPVYTVATDAQGRYTLYLPEGGDANVLVVASLPGSREARQAHNLFTPPTGRDQALDDDSAIVTGLLRLALAERLRRYFAIADHPPQAGHDAAAQALSLVGEDFIRQVLALARARGTHTWTFKQQLALAQAVSDPLLLPINPHELMMSTAFVKWESKWGEPPSGPALPRLTAMMGELRVASADLMARRGPQAMQAEIDDLITGINASIDQRNQAKTAGESRQERVQPRRIEKPSDVAEFIVQDLHARDEINDRENFANQLTIDLGVAKGATDEERRSDAWRWAAEMAAGVGGLLFELTRNLTEPEAQKRALDVIEHFVPPPDDPSPAP